MSPRKLSVRMTIGFGALMTVGFWYLLTLVGFSGGWSIFFAWVASGVITTASASMLLIGLEVYDSTKVKSHQDCTDPKLASNGFLP